MDPIVIHPRVGAHHLSREGCPETRASFFFLEVVDKRGNADPRDVGFAQTGIDNTQVALYAEPVPADLVKTAFSTLLGRCGLLAETLTEADYLVETGLVALQTIELSGSLVEELHVIAGCEIVVRDADSTALRLRTVIESAHERRGIDTTQYASTAVASAIIDLAEELAAVLECCQELPR